jgi:hypothetical protein
MSGDEASGKKPDVTEVESIIEKRYVEWQRPPARVHHPLAAWLPAPDRLQRTAARRGLGEGRGRAGELSGRMSCPGECCRESVRERGEREDKRG